MLEPRHRLGAILAHDAAAPRIVVGDVEIAEQASVWSGCTQRGDVHISPEKPPTIVGADVRVGHGVMLHGCTLDDDCFVGMHANVLNGAVVESGALVAAGALVVEGTRVLRGEVWGGAMRDGEFDDMRAAARRYVVLAARQAALARPVGGAAR